MGPVIFISSRIRSAPRRYGRWLAVVYAVMLGIDAVAADWPLADVAERGADALLLEWSDMPPADDTLERRRLPTNAAAVRRAVVRLDALEATYRSRHAAVQLTAADGFTYRFSLDRVEHAASGGRVWVLSPVGGDAGHSVRELRSYVSEQVGQVTGLIELPSTSLELLPFAAERPGEVLVVDTARAGRERALYVADDTRIPPPFDKRPPWMQADSLRMRAAPTHDWHKAAPSPHSTIDILIAYTPGMVTRYGSPDAVIARLNQLVAYANTAYLTSEVAITLRLVHSVQVGYPDSGANDAALFALTGHNGSTSVPVPPSLAMIAGLRNTHGADLVALVRPYMRSSHGGCGIAWVGGYEVTDIGDDAPFAFSVTSDGSDVGGTGFFCSLGTFAHELGHNMGLMHNRAHSGGGRGATPYAYGYIIPGTSDGDVMSYAPGRLQAFSNPGLRCSGAACSIGGSGQALGVPADGTGEACLGSASGCSPGQAAACTSNPTTCADAARALNFTRVKVAAYRAAASPPSISGMARLSGGAPVADGTPVCAAPAAGVTCTATVAGQYNCSVPAGWTGTLHLMAGNAFRVPARRFTTGVTAAVSGQDFAVQAAGAFACNLDVDNNGLLETQVDGVMVVRRILGLTGTPATVAGNGACAQRTSAIDKWAFLATQSFDFDGGGASAAREGLLLLRLMLGVPGAQAVAGTGYSWPAAQTAINSNCGTSF